MQRGFNLKPLFDDGNQDVSAYGDPNLRFDGVDAVAHKSLDSQVLFDPFEEQLNLPSTLVKRGYLSGGQFKVVRDEYKFTLLCLIQKFDPAQHMWIGLVGKLTC